MIGEFEVSRGPGSGLHTLFEKIREKKLGAVDRMQGILLFWILL